MYTASTYTPEYIFGPGFLSSEINTRPGSPNHTNTLRTSHTCRHAPPPPPAAPAYLPKLDMTELAKPATRPKQSKPDYIRPSQIRTAPAAGLLI